MKYALVALACILAMYAAYEYVRISRLVHVGEAPGREAAPFSSESGTVALLVLGDSTAVGVGAKAEESVAGRLSRRLNASVENYAISGATTRDIAAQFSLAKKDKYDLVLLQVGANDVIRFSNLETLRKDISQVLGDVSSVSNRVVLLTAGKVGNAPFFPRPFAWLWTKRAALVREHFITAAHEHGAAYVDLFVLDDGFDVEPEKFYARDGLHLSGEGYAFWYAEVMKAIEKKWPEIVHES